MTRKIVVVSAILASAVATAGTFTVSYPDGYDTGSFKLGVGHKLLALGSVFTSPDDFTITFGATAATITYNGATTLPAGTAISFQFDGLGEDVVTDQASAVPIYTPVTLGVLELGAPKVADADGILVSASVLAATGDDTVLTGALVSGGEAVMDALTGRNVVAAWTGTAVLTVNGFDMYGNAMTESSASGTSLAGKKAFKTVTSFSFSANVTGCTIGSGDVIGLPVYVGDASQVLKESQDGAAATAGTIVVGAAGTKQTATTGDPRGTYDPNAACDGAKTFTLLTAIADPSYLGATHYAA